MKQQLNLYIEQGLVEDAKKKGLALSKIFEEALTQQLGFATAKEEQDLQELREMKISVLAEAQALKVPNEVFLHLYQKEKKGKNMSLPHDAKNVWESVKYSLRLWKKSKESTPIPPKEN